jgi:GH24 family phage-related lysozyme (muramidase)
LGVFDQTSTDTLTLLRDIPHFSEWNDWSAPNPSNWLPRIGQGAFCMVAGGAPLASAIKPSVSNTVKRVMANTHLLSKDAIRLLQKVESLRLKPYDDQKSGGVISSWVVGATIGYGHLISESEWNTYKNGITEFVAHAVFMKDVAHFDALVGLAIKVKMTQNEFDVLVILAYNIGQPAFRGSSLVKLINNPTAKTQ